MKFFCRYLYSHSIDNKFTDRLINKNVLSIKLLSVIFYLSVSPSVIKLPIDLLTVKARQNNFH